VLEPDEALWARHLRGDADAFAAIVDRYGPPVSRLMHRAVRRPQDADELVQDTFLHLNRSAADFDPQRPLRPWVMCIAMNLRREYFRRQGRRPEDELEDADRWPAEGAVDPHDQRDAARALERAMGGLSADQREVIELFWFGELSMAEVAAVVGASVSAVKVRAHRGYERMREVLRSGR
jgi:RNA polymerase sigma factor (sigma-70 family)